MNMRFAWTPHDQGIVATIGEWINANRQLEIFALLDASMFAPSALRDLAQHGLALHSAFAGTPLAVYEETGPLICRLGDAGHNAIERLLWKAKGVPAISFVAARSEAASLCECLAWLALVQTDDGQTQFCRYADTRILPNHLDCFLPEQTAALAAAVAAWAWVARDGRLRERRFEVSGDGIDLEHEPLRLNAAQFEYVMTAAEPDMLFQMLAESSPDLIIDDKPHQFHARLAKLIEAAKGHGLADLPDLFTYITVALLTVDQFDQHSVMQETWMSLKKGEGRFGELVGQWPESTMNTLRTLKMTAQKEISAAASPTAQDGNIKYE